MGLSTCTNDGALGPGSSCRDLDFTLYFENWALSFAPDLVFIFIGCARLASCMRGRKKLERLGLLFPLKVLFAVLLIAMSAMRIQEVRTAKDLPHAGNTAAAATSLVSSIILSALSLSEHIFSIAPSTLVILYSLIRPVFNGAILRTYVRIGMIDDHRLLFISTAIQTGSFVLVLLAELVEKRSLLLPQYRTDSHEATSSFPKRMTYSWLIPLLWRGRRTLLTLDDLKDIPQAFKAEPTRQALIDVLRVHPDLNLFQAVFNAFGLTLLWPVIPRIVLLLLTFAQPLLLNDLVTFIDEPFEPISKGWAIVGGFVAVYGMMIVATAVYWEKVFYNVVQIRAALVGAIYMKSLRLSSEARAEIGGGAATTHMSTDVELIARMFEFVHEVWDALLSTALALIILYGQAGWPAFLPIPVLLFVMVVCGAISVYVGKIQVAWLGAVDKRVKFMSSILNNFLSVKWSNYESPIATRVRELREIDVKWCGKLFNIMNVTMAISSNAATLSMLTVLGTYAALQSKGDLGPSRLFTIVTTLGLLNSPIMLLGQYAQVVMMGYTSMKRISTFLTLEERQDSQKITEEQSNKEKNESNEEEKEKDDTERVLLRMEMASFSWTKEGETFLKDVDLTVVDGDVIILLGKVGSGKSMVLKSLIGETLLKSGNYTVTRTADGDDRIAYAGQDAFIMPGTIRENILFGRPYDKGAYERAVSACALVEDLEGMAEGDATLLHEGGGSLSGGQRQRIGLARAVYANATVVLLDCCFSALDAKTEDHVFGALFGSHGLLRGKTIILATHNVQHISIASELKVLDAGRIVHRGTPDEIRAQGYDLADLAKQLASEKNEPSSGGANATTDTSEPEANNPKTPGLTASDLEAAEDVTGRGISSFLFYGRLTGWGKMTIWITLALLASGASLGSQGYLQRWSVAPSDEYRQWIGGYAGLSVGTIALTTIMFGYFIHISRNTARKLHEKELNGLFNAAPSFLLKTPAGQIINRFSEDIAEFDITLPVTMFSAMTQGLSMIGTVVIVMIPAPWLALTLLALIPFYVALIWFYLATSKQLQKLEMASKSPLYTLFGTTLSGLDTIRAFSAQTFFQGQNDAFLNISQGPYYYRQAGMRLLRTGLTLITFVLAIGLSSMAVGLRSSSSASLFGLALSNLTNLTTQLNAWFLSYTMYENSTVSLNRIRKLVDLPPEYTLGAGKPSHDKNGTDWPSKGSVDFKNVGFRYKEDGPKILTDISFSAKPGLKVGICGRTGAGKSTVAMALLRAVDASLTSGSIMVDGVDIGTLEPAQVRRSISLVTQEPFLWESSLRENLDIDARCTDVQIWEALDAVGMKETIIALPENLETVLQAGGSFSRGERQLLCMARVLLRNRSIVVLDEATSSLDVKSDQKIIDLVNTHLKDQTVLAIAHRISTIIGFDLIIVMADGRIQEIGPSQDLLADKKSHFHALAANQGLISAEGTITS